MDQLEEVQLQDKSPKVKNGYVFILLDGRSFFSLFALRSILFVDLLVDPPNYHKFHL